MKTIAVELSVRGCQNALKELQRHEQEIKPKLDEVCRRLAEMGMQTAISIINQVRIDEGNAVENIETVKTENGYKIVMSGEDVYFIEFGTGNGVSAHYNVSVPVAWGSWSATHSQILLTRGYWYYNRIRFEGTPAYMPMYYAEKTIRENADRIVREVFGV